MNPRIVKVWPCLAVCWLLLSVLGASSWAQNVRDGFAPDLDLSARIVLQQADGQLLIAGDFTQIDGVARHRLARLRIDGSLDTSFDAVLDGGVESLVLQPDGQLLVGGDFAQTGSLAQSWLARLDASGAPDLSFRPVLDAPASAIALQADGSVLVGGSFAEIGSIAQPWLARLDAAGVPDESFRPALDGSVSTIAVQSDGRILLGGRFTGVSGASQAYVARLNADGTPDPTFAPPPFDAAVERIAVQSDGQIVVAGAFVAPAVGLVRLNVDGSLDGGFVAGLDGSVASVGVQADGRLLITGAFGHVGGMALRYAARLNVDGSPDPSFDARANDAVYVLLQQYDGKVAFGGGFTTVHGVARRYLARLNADGSPDLDFIAGGDPNYPGVLGELQTVAMQPDGKILIGGELTFVGSTPGGQQIRLMRLNADGSIDESFHVPSFDAGARVASIAIRPDGKILVGGSFALVDGQSRSSLALLAPDGTLDPDFSLDVIEIIGGSVVRGTVLSLHQERASALLIVGRFNQIGGVRRMGVARMRADGSIDPAFDTGALDDVVLTGAAPLPDGRVLVNGPHYLDWTFKLRLLDADGSLNAAFWPATDQHVFSFSRQDDGQILISGEFTQIDGTAAPYFARLLPDGTRDSGFAAPVADGAIDTFAEQADGSLLLAGRFTHVDGQARASVARLDPAGTLDPGYDPNIGMYGSSSDGARVSGIVLQADGKALAYGDFSGVGGVERTRIARLSSPQAVVQRLEPVEGGSGVHWLRGGAAAALARVAFEWSADRQTWRPLGDGHAIEGGWAIDAVALPHGRNVWIRALGYPKHAPAYSLSTASESMHESVRLVYLPGPETFRVAPQAGIGGRIDPAVAQLVEPGASMVFTLTADAGHRLDEVTGCGGQLDADVYTTAPIEADCDIVANFVRDDGERIFGDGFESPSR